MNNKSKKLRTGRIGRLPFAGEMIPAVSWFLSSFELIRD